MGKLYFGFGRPHVVCTNPWREKFFKSGVHYKKAKCVQLAFFGKSCTFQNMNDFGISFFQQILFWSNGLKHFILKIRLSILKRDFFRHPPFFSLSCNTNQALYSRKLLIKPRKYLEVLFSEAPHGYQDRYQNGYQSSTHIRPAPSQETCTKLSGL